MSAGYTFGFGAAKPTPAPVPSIVLPQFPPQQAKSSLQATGIFEEVNDPLVAEYLEVTMPISTGSASEQKMDHLSTTEEIIKPIVMPAKSISSKTTNGKKEIVHPSIARARAQIGFVQAMPPPPPPASTTIAPTRDRTIAKQIQPKPKNPIVGVKAANPSTQSAGIVNYSVSEQKRRQQKS